MNPPQMQDPLEKAFFQKINKNDYNVIKNVLDQNKLKTDSMNRGIVYAAKKNKLCSLNLLLSRSGVDPSYNNNEALIKAISGKGSRSNSIIEALLNDNRIKNVNAEKVIGAAIRKGKKDTLELFMGKFPGVASDVALKMAAKKDPKVLKLLPYLSHDNMLKVAKISMKNSSTKIPLMVISKKYFMPDQELFLEAIRYNKLAVVKKIANKQGFDPSANSNEAYKLAMSRGNASIVNYLFSNTYVKGKMYTQASTNIFGF